MLYLSKKYDSQLKSEKNINILKQNLKDLEQENIKLKNTVEKMLSKVT